MLPMAVARSSSSGVVTRYVHPVLWMTSCLPRLLDVAVHAAEAQYTRSLGLCYLAVRSNTCCRPTDARDYLTGALSNFLGGNTGGEVCGL